MHTLQTHPGEGSQEEEMQKASKDGTGNLRVAARERQKTREAAERKKKGKTEQSHYRVKKKFGYFQEKIKLSRNVMTHCLNLSFRVTIQ